MLECSESDVAASTKPVSPKLDDDLANKTEKQGPLEKTPSNVRKMISAFESSVSQDISLPTKLHVSTSPLKRVGIEDPSRDQDLKHTTKLAETSSGRLKYPSLTGNLQPIQANVNERGEHIGFDKDLVGMKSTQATGQSKASIATNIQSEGVGSSIKNSFQAAHKKLPTQEPVKSPEDLMRASISEIATVSGRMHKELSGIVQPQNRSAKQGDPIGTSVLEGGEMGIGSKNLHEISIEGPSNEKLKSVAFCEQEHSLLQTSGMWILPDKTRHLCITTASKKVRNLLGDCPIKASSHQGKKSFSVPENMQKRTVTDDEMKKSEKKSNKVRKSRPESSADDASTGLVGQEKKRK
ncbi:unnamed protein product [Ilex paraguariensis]